MDRRALSYDPASPLLRAPTEAEPVHVPAHADRVRRARAGRYVPVAHDHRYGPLWAFLGLLGVQTVLLLLNLGFSLATALRWGGAGRYYVAAIFSPLSVLTAILSLFSLLLHIYLLSHKHLPAWKSLVINILCFFLWAALSILRWLSTLGLCLLAVDATHGSCWFHLAPADTLLQKTPVLPGGSGGSGGEGEGDGEGMGDLGRALALATAAIYALHTVWAGVVHVRLWWGEWLARAERDRAAWNEYVRDQEDLESERRRVVPLPARDVEHWGHGYGYGAF